MLVGQAISLGTQAGLGPASPQTTGELGRRLPHQAWVFLRISGFQVSLGVPGGSMELPQGLWMVVGE